MNIDKCYIRTDLKWLINVECEGFDMDEDDFDVELRCGAQCYKCKDSEVVKEGDDWYLCIDTTKFKPGLLQMVFMAYVPDDAFEDGTRTEVGVLNLCQLREIPTNKNIML